MYAWFHCAPWAIELSYSTGSWIRCAKFCNNDKVVIAAVSYTQIDVLNDLSTQFRVFSHDCSNYTLKQGVSTTLDNVIVGGSDGVVWIINLSTGRDIRRLDVHTSPVRAASLSRDGTLLLSGASDGKVKIGDLMTGKTTVSYQADAEGISTVSFNKLGNHILTAGADGSSRFGIYRRRAHSLASSLATADEHDHGA